jgi:hypothetical protein
VPDSRLGSTLEITPLEIVRKDELDREDVLFAPDKSAVSNPKRQCGTTLELTPAQGADTVEGAQIWDCSRGKSLRAVGGRGRCGRRPPHPHFVY